MPDYNFYIDTPERDSHLKGASIAGFRQGSFTDWKKQEYPSFLRIEMFGFTTKLSDFNKSSYSPLTAWQSTIRGILSTWSIEMEKEP